jgi:deoxyadenosine/deoxycytidine kinase
MVRTLKNELTEDTMAAKASLVVEVMGPAGTGKTTLSRALSQRHDDIAPDIDIRLSKLDKLPFVISNTFSLLPTYLRRYRHSRWFNRRETRSMAYLQAGLRLLGQETPNNDRVIVLDHGPIYRLAFLREFGPEITTSHAYQRWWAKLLKQWIAKIDIVISLDAPNVVLLERIRARDCRHTIKAKSDQEAYEILRRYRAAFEQTIAEFLAARPVTVLHFDTSQQSTEEIVDSALATFASALNAGQSRELEFRLRGT